MSANSSSTSNSSNFPFYYCSNSKVSFNISIAIGVVRTILTLPLYTLVLYLGHQRWRQQRSFKTTSHSDIFTYHMAALDLIWIMGFCFYFCGTYANLSEMIIVALCALFISFYGEASFHLLTCVERYLAVVHPITYMRLRQSDGVRIRNISIRCVWLLCFGSMGVMVLYMPNYPTIPFFCLLVFSLIVVSFCSLSVLCVLIHPGPGKGDKEKEFVDQSKRRAFHTITAIMAVLWLWFAGLLVSVALNASPLLSASVGCVVMTSTGWFNLPSSLVLPLLCLHRAGKLSSRCYNNE